MSAITISNETFDNLLQTQNGSVENAVDAFISKYPIVIFSKSYCPYTSAVKYQLVEHMQIKKDVHVLEINLLNDTANTKAIQSHLQQTTGFSTFPQVFVDGEFVGTHDGIMELAAKGLLENKVKRHMTGPDLTGAQVESAAGTQGTYTPLFWFPASVNKWGIRATGLLSCGISGSLAYAMLTGTEPHPSMLGFVAAALFGDYTLRLVSGSKVSPIAQLGGKLASLSQLTPIPRPGAPKQFASFCGTMFSGLGTAFYAAGNPTLGGGFLAVLALCSGMEGAIDYCLGCTFFSIGDQLFGHGSRNKRKVM